MSRINVNQIYNLSGSVPTIATPHFRVIRTTNQTLTSGVTASVQWNSVVYDPNNWFDTVNYAWKPQLAGYYWLSTILHVSGTSTNPQVTGVADGSYARFEGFLVRAA